MQLKLGEGNSVSVYKLKGKVRTEQTEFKKFLKKKQLKFTPERQVILNGLLSLHRHFDVDALYDKLRKKGKNVSRTSIYRTLPLLIQCGFITETFRCQGRGSYEHIFGHEQHDHMLCIKCGRIIEFRDEKIENLQKKICKRYGFKPVERKLDIRGYCKKCKAEQNFFDT